jgi:cell division transport system permease protein
VFSHGFRSFASITVIAACLLIMGSFALVGINIDSIIRDMERESQILAFVDESLTQDDARLLEGAIRTLSNVREVKFITREEALENYKAQYEDTSLFDDIDATVLRNRYVVYLNDITLMENTKEALENVPGVADVNAEVGIAKGFITVRNVVSVITAILIVVLLVVSLFMMSNTIKLATYTRREEIAIMKMVGANNGFIRFPFVVEGLIMGVLGAGIGFLLQWLIYNFITGRIMNSMAGNLFHLLPFATIMTPLLLVYLAVGILVGAFGGGMAIRNYLKV